mmetsp:Transcript_343/g.490  ORF Transcript_343/g.490 Transcript_343/m.490 type:complete len:412 (-) Transcript_343:679-1914(-)
MHEPLLRGRKLHDVASDPEPGIGKKTESSMRSEEAAAEAGLCCYLCGCRPRCSGNIKTLLTVIVLFSVVSIAQLLGSWFANSLALLGDSISMGIDTLTFCGNLYAECSISKHRVTIQLVASGISLFALSIFTISVIVEAIDRLYYSDKYTVDPYIVLGFSFVGLCFDVICFVAYYYWGSDPFDPTAFEPEYGQHKKLEDKPSSKAMITSERRFSLGPPPPSRENTYPAQRANGFYSEREESGKEATTVLSREPTSLELSSPEYEAMVEVEMARINMCSALMHVGSDALRSITTLIEGLLILYTDLDSENTDAVASLIVSSIIVIGTIGAIWQWGQQCLRHYRGDLISATPSDLTFPGSEKKSSDKMSSSGQKMLKSVASDSYQQAKSKYTGFVNNSAVSRIREEGETSQDG